MWAARLRASGCSGRAVIGRGALRGRLRPAGMQQRVGLCACATLGECEWSVCSATCVHTICIALQACVAICMCAHICVSAPCARELGEPSCHRVGAASAASVPGGVSRPRCPTEMSAARNLLASRSSYALGGLAPPNQHSVLASLAPAACLLSPRSCWCCQEAQVRWGSGPRIGTPAPSGEPWTARRTPGSLCLTV